MNYQLNLSEARTIIYLSNVDNAMKTKHFVAAKLGFSITHISNLLGILVAKGVLVARNMHDGTGKYYYFINPTLDQTTLLNNAIEIVGKQKDKSDNND